MGVIESGCMLIPKWLWWWWCCQNPRRTDTHAPPSRLSREYYVSRPALPKVCSVEPEESKRGRQRFLHEEFR